MMELKINLNWKRNCIWRIKIFRWTFNWAKTKEYQIRKYEIKSERSCSLLATGIN